MKYYHKVGRLSLSSVTQKTKGTYLNYINRELSRHYGKPHEIVDIYSDGNFLSDYGMSSLKIFADLTIILFMFGGFVYCLFAL